MLIISGSELQGTVQEVENLRKEVDKLKHSGETDLGVNLKTAIRCVMLTSGAMFGVNLCSKLLVGWRGFEISG